MRWFSGLFCMLGLGTGVLLAGNAARAFSDHAPYTAPDVAIIAAVLASESSLPSGITLEMKTDGLPPVRSTLLETARGQIPYARQVRAFIENFDEALDGETVEGAIWYDEPAAIPRSPRSKDSDLDGRLRDIGLELDLSRAFETSA